MIRNLIILFLLWVCYTGCTSLEESKLNPVQKTFSHVSIHDTVPIKLIIKSTTDTINISNTKKIKLEQAPSSTEIIEIVEVTLNDALSQFKQNSFEKAFQSFQKYHIQNPTNDTALFYLGVIASKMGGYKLSNQYFDLTLINTHNEDYSSLIPYYKAYNYQKYNDFNNAKRIYLSLIDAKNVHDSLYIKLGDVYHKTNQTDSALHYYYKILSPTQELHFTIGELLMQQKKYQQAIEQFDRIDTHTTPTYFFYLGNCYLEKYRVDTALFYLHKGYDLDTSYIEIVFDIGVCYYFKKEYKKALLFFQKVTQLYQYDIKALINQALCLHHLDNTQASIEVFQHILTIDPHHSDALYNIGLIHYENNLYSKALEYYLDLAEIEPNNGENWYNIGQCYLQLNQNKLACEAFNDAKINNFERSKFSINKYCRDK